MIWRISRWKHFPNLWTCSRLIKSKISHLTWHIVLTTFTATSTVSFHIQIGNIHLWLNIILLKVLSVVFKVISYIPKVM